MKKKLIIIGAVAASLVLLSACGEKKILHCDACGEEVKVKASSNMEEDWLIYCEKCNEEFFANDPIFQKQQ